MNETCPQIEDDAASIKDKGQGKFLDIAPSTGVRSASAAPLASNARNVPALEGLRGSFQFRHHKVDRRI
jgi:hypothetical protein